MCDWLLGQPVGLMRAMTRLAPKMRILYEVLANRFRP